MPGQGGGRVLGGRRGGLEDGALTPRLAAVGRAGKGGEGRGGRRGEGLGRGKGADGVEGGTARGWIAQGFAAVGKAGKQQGSGVGGEADYMTTSWHDSGTLLGLGILPVLLLPLLLLHLTRSWHTACATAAAAVDDVTMMPLCYVSCSPPPLHLPMPLRYPPAATPPPPHAPALSSSCHPSTPLCPCAILQPPPLHPPPAPALSPSRPPFPPPCYPPAAPPPHTLAPAQPPNSPPAPPVPRTALDIESASTHPPVPRTAAQCPVLRPCVPYCGPVPPARLTCPGMGAAAPMPFGLGWVAQS